MESKYFFLVCLVVILYIVSTYCSTVEEGFQNAKDEGRAVSYEDPESMYDSVIASIYNVLWHSNEKLEYERISIQELALADWPTKSVKVLDACCGTAPHACFFKNLGVDYTGIDISSDMIEQAKKDCPGTKFVKDDITKVQLFAPKTLSHCLLLNFSIYQFMNPKVVSDNFFSWLEPGGYFIVHLVNPDKFDPLLDLATPFAAFSLQKYSIDRVTDSSIFFDKFKYLGKFAKKKGEDEATYTETLTYYSPEKEKYRENIHRWNMPSRERMINIIQSSGFRHVEDIDLVRCGKEYQYLTYFTK